jgi:hypothetical protein
LANRPQEDAARQPQPDRAGEQTLRIVQVRRLGGECVSRKCGIAGHGKRNGERRACCGTGRGGQPRDRFIAERQIKECQIGTGGKRPHGRR